MRDNKEKYYILHYPSSWGMGSNVDVSLVTETNLRKIIAHELTKRKRGELYDSRFTGTWNNELQLQSNNIEEVIDDVIEKRLNTCSTYARFHDLIEIPDDIPVTVVTEEMDNTIFRLCNQWLYERDIIVGKAYLTRYRIDLTAYTGELGLENGRCHEFIEYDLKKVAENHFFHSTDGVIAMLDNSLGRIKDKLDGKKPDYEGHYIDDICPEIGTEEWYNQRIREAQATIEKFSDMPEIKDEYVKHIYRQKNMRYEGFRDIIEDQEEEDKRIDFTKVAYQYPLMPDKFACEIVKEKDDSSYLSYGELFIKGDDIHYLLADYAGEMKHMDDFGEPDMFAALKGVFGYD